MGVIEVILGILLILIAMVMIFFIMLQESKGGGLAALGGTKAAQVEGVSNPIRKATVYMAGAYFLIAIVIGLMNRESASMIKADKMFDTPAPLIEDKGSKGKDEASPADLKDMQQMLEQLAPSVVPPEESPADNKEVESNQSSSEKLGQPVENSKEKTETSSESKSE